jgi:hypothetical protein
MSDKKYINLIKPKLSAIIKDPLDNQELLQYLPNAKILTYNQLADYQNINELLPNEKDFFILLYQQQPNVGHWVSVDKIGNTISYFDSYGKPVDEPLDWNSDHLNKMLGQSNDYLSNLLDNSDYNIEYNNVKYQNSNNNVNTCGRFVVLRVLCAKKGMNLKQFYEMMEKLKNYKEMNYDQIVSYIINI